MDRSIVIKTDASYKQEVGCGVSYIANIDNGEGMNLQFKNSKFIRDVENSTHAETIAVVYAVFEILNKVDQKEQYRISVRTDCEYTATKLDETHPEQRKTVKTAKNLLDRFPHWDVQWIPRSTNKKADALARSKLMHNDANN